MRNICVYPLLHPGPITLSIFEMLHQYFVVFFFIIIIFLLRSELHFPPRLLDGERACRRCKPSTLLSFYGSHKDTAGGGDTPPVVAYVFAALWDVKVWCKQPCLFFSAGHWLVHHADIHSSVHVQWAVICFYHLFIFLLCQEINSTLKKYL